MTVCCYQKSLTTHALEQNLVLCSRSLRLSLLCPNQLRILWRHLRVFTKQLSWLIEWWRSVFSVTSQLQMAELCITCQFTNRPTMGTDIWEEMVNQWMEFTVSCLIKQYIGHLQITPFHSSPLIHFSPQSQHIFFPASVELDSKSTLQVSWSMTMRYKFLLARFRSSCPTSSFAY